MVALVDKILTLHRESGEVKTPDEKTRIQRQIDATDQQIDPLGCEMYGLTSEGIKIFEGEKALGGGGS